MVTEPRGSCCVAPPRGPPRTAPHRAPRRDAADDRALAARLGRAHDRVMKRPIRPPVIRLLTQSEAAARLGMTEIAVDALLAAGTLHALKVSPHGGQRYWPADIAALAAGTAPDHAFVDPAPSETEPAPAPAPARPAAPHRATRAPLRVRRPSGPRWAGWSPVQTPRPSSYLAFRDAEHVSAYLRVRAEVATEPDDRVLPDRTNLHGTDRPLLTARPTAVPSAGEHVAIK